jgi:hypothetical protein
VAMAALLGMLTGAKCLGTQPLLSVGVQLTCIVCCCLCCHAAKV